MLTKLRIKNFKCLQDTGELDIRPLTFLVGPNSSGKSSILQVLLMLRQTVDSTDPNVPLATSNGWIEMGAYPDFVYKHECDTNLEFHLEFSVSEKDWPFGGLDRSPNQLSMVVVFSYNPKTTNIELEESVLVLDDILTTKVVKGIGKQYSAIQSWQEKKGRKKKKKVDDVRPHKFYHFRPAFLKEGGFYPYPFPVFPPGFLIEKWFRNVFYLGPLRESPRRFYVTSGQTPQDVGIKGERAIAVWWSAERGETKKIRELKKEIQYWFKKLGMGNLVRLDKIGKANLYTVTVKDLFSGIEANLADIGFGASQTLPIIIESLYAPEGSTLLIEQPEIHLHPRAQSVLGDLFLEASKRGHRNFIIETHSEHILARVRRRIAEGKIKAEDIAIYYFEPTSEGTSIKRVTLNKYGQYESFPHGFFDEDINEAFEHLKAINQANSK